MPRKTVAVIVLCFVLLGLALPTPAAAQFFVYDPAVWYQAILAWYQRYEQIRNQYEQIRALQKQLESFADQGDFNSLNGVLGQLDQIFAVGENLGYLLAGVEEVFAETFPGYEPPISWPDEYALRVKRSRDTLHLITQALNRLTWPNTRSQVMLDRITAHSKRADSPLEELEVLSMWQSLHVTEAQRSLQAQLLAANAVTVAAAADLQREASAEAARSSWLERETAPLPGLDPSEGFTGVPANWPWRF
jgi:P-type conjugative transfer protein TrbJ